MGYLEMLLLGVGVSADAFAVAICKGLDSKKFRKKNATIIALFFGGFQFFMTAIGWLLAYNFSKYIENIDHWIAFTLLAFLGGKMLYESFKQDPGTCSIEEPSLDIKELFLLSIATSIDALAVGISLAIVHVPILAPAIIIGICTFNFSYLAVYIGYRFGCKFQKQSEIIGGIILIIIGLKILIDHTIFL